MVEARPDGAPSPVLCPACGGSAKVLWATQHLEPHRIPGGLTCPVWGVTLEQAAQPASDAAAARVSGGQ